LRSPAIMWAAPATSTTVDPGTDSSSWSTPSWVTTSLSSPRTSMVGTRMFPMAVFSRSTSTSHRLVAPWLMKAGSQCQNHRPSALAQDLAQAVGVDGRVRSGV